MNLLVRQIYRAVQRGVGLVDQGEDLFQKARILQAAAHLEHMQLLPVQHIVGNPPPALQHLGIGGGGNQVFHPIHILHIAQRLHVLHVIGVIVVCKEAAAAVEAFDEHAFPVHVREAKRAVHRVTAQRCGPILYRAEQSPGNLRIVDEIHLRKAQTVGAPLFVGLPAEDGADAADDLPIPIGQPAAGLHLD